MKLRSLTEKLALLWLVATTLASPAFSSGHAHAARVAPAPARRTLARELEQITAYNFDWDDNIFFMPTKIVVFEKGTGTEKLVSTADFALIRTQLGQPGPWQNYETRDGDQGSFRYFRDAKDGTNYFLNDIKAALSEGTEKFKGPSWDAFVRAMENPETARWTTIITARGHSAEAMVEGLKHLRELGLIRNLPPLENLFAVSNPKYAGTASDPSGTKAAIMEQILDRIEGHELSLAMAPVLDRDGHARRPMHLWGFSDDDFGNYSKALEVLSKGIRAGRWLRIKITLFFTGGKNNPSEKPRTTVLKDDGVARPAMDAEIGEAERVLCSRKMPALLLNP